MADEMSQAINNDFRAAVAGLEMEISDSVLKDLLTAISARIQEESNDSAVGMILLAMESVVGYVDSLRVRSDPGAFNLIDDLWQAYVRLRTTTQEEKERQQFSLAKMKKVLDWQQQCLIDGAGEKPVKVIPGRNLSSAMAELVQKEIAATGDLVQQELAALKQAAGSLSTAHLHRTDLEQHVSSAIVKQFDSLQEVMDKEISKLRQELQEQE